MIRQRWKLWMRGTAVAALLCCGANANAQTATIPAPPAVPAVPGVPAGGAPLTVHTTFDARGPEVEQLIKKMQQAKFWIGVECGPLVELLKSQLQLEHGVVAMSVMDESPASKAGLQKFDILLQLGDEKLRDVSQLIDVVDALGAKEATLRVMRGGKELSLSITPIERPQRAAADPNALEMQLRNSLGGLPEKVQKDVRVMVVRPGTVFPTDLGAVKLPEGMSISISKSDDKPATIDVQQGEKKWSVTEDELDKLPPEIRVHVERMRAPMVHLQGPAQFRTLPPGGTKVAGRIEVIPSAVPVIPGAVPPGDAVVPRVKVHSLPAVPGQPSQLAELHQKLDQVLKAVQQQGQGQGSIDQLQKEVDRLRQDVETLQKQLKERN